MKQEIENIDRIFIEGIDGLYKDNPASAGWRKMRTRMIFRKAYLSKMNRVYSIAIASVFIIVPLIYFLSSFFYSAESRNNSILNNQATLFDVTLNTELTSINRLQKKQLGLQLSESIQSSKLTDNKLPVNVYGSLPTVVKANNQNTKVVDENHENTYDAIGYLVNKSIDSVAFSTQKSFAENIYSKEYALAANMEVYGLNDESKLYLGFTVGTDLFLNSTEIQNHPTSLFSGGLVFKYEAKKFFLNSSVNLSYFESVNKYGYFFDTLAGQLVYSGFEIVPVVNNNGDTTWSKVYNDAFTNVYDTVLSDEQISMTSFKTMVSIPLSIGKNLYKNNNFNASVFGGLTINVMFNKEQSVPEFANDNQQIIKLDKNLSNDVYGQIYIHGGILLGYKMSKNTTISFESSYHYGFKLLGSDQYTFPISYINIKAGLLFKL